MVDSSDDDFEEWSDDEDGFDDFDDEVYEGDQSPSTQSNKKPMLVMGGAIVLLSVIGGYLAKDILLQPQDTPLTPNTVNISASDPLSQQATAPSAIPPDNGQAPADLSVYNTDNAANLVEDSDFGVDMSGGMDANENPFDDLSDMGGAPVENNDTPVAIPFDNPNTGNPDDDTIISIETLNIDDLSAPQAPVMEIPSQEMVQNQNEIENQPESTAPQDQNIISQLTDIVDTQLSETTISNGGNDDVSAAQMQSQMDGLKRENDQLTKEISSLNQKIDFLEGALKSKDTAAKEVTTPPAQQDSSADAPQVRTRTITTPPKPTLPPIQAKQWVLRAATSNQAVISEPGSQNLISVSVGENVPGYGRVQSIFWSPDSGWQILTAGGAIRQ